MLYAGVTSLTESVKKILHPETPDYTAVSLILVAAAVVVKIVLGAYVKHVGKKVNSSSLVNSGTDATLDAVISASTLAAAGILERRLARSLARRGDLAGHHQIRRRDAARNDLTAAG